MKKLVLFLALVYTTILLPQNPDTQAIIAPQGFGINLLNSKGNSSIDNDISNIGFMNPAAISNFANYSFGLSYQISSEIEDGWIADIGTKRKNDWMPQSAGAIYKFDQLSLGIGFGQKYNGGLFSEPTPIATREDPDGTGEYFTFESQTRVQSYSFSAAYSCPEIFNKSSSLVFGIRYSYNHLKYYSKLWYMSSTETSNVGSFALGIQYSNTISENRMLKVGFSYEIGPDFEKQFEYIYSGININPDTIGVIQVNSKFNLIGNVPDKFNLDVSADLTESFRLNAMITGVLWEGDNDQLKNQIEFSVSGIYRINEMFAPSFGFYYTDKNFDENIFDINEKLDALFLMAGLKFNYDIFSANLAIADSHLFSGDFRKQIIAKLAFSVSL